MGYLAEQGSSQVKAHYRNKSGKCFKDIISRWGAYRGRDST
jgi:hypothetical protein